MQIAKNLWIQNPTSDIIFYSFGWVAVLLLLVIFQNNWAAIILIVLLTSYLHRHYTFALVYGETEEFERHRLIYIGLPIVSLIATVLFVYYDSFKILFIISVVWTIYHTIAQKYGITRIYSRKAGYGEARTELWAIYSWAIFLFLYTAISQQETLMKYKMGKFFLTYMNPHMEIIHIVSGVLLAVCIFFTARYFYIEYKNRDKISIPKNIYVISIFLLYSVFLYSVVAGYIVFGFSHAIEYIAFVNFFVDRKYKKKPESKSILAKASKNLWLYSSVFALAVVGLTFLGHRLDKNALEIYVVGTSFMHFTYDGMIWKVRRPEVGKPLEIKYKST